MNPHGTAFFVDDPRSWEDLLRPHLIEQEKPFEIARTITLKCIDFENFITDMLVSRDYLEDPDGRCSRAQVWRCFFVHQRGHTEGVLVVPDREGFADWAAWLPGDAAHT